MRSKCLILLMTLCFLPVHAALDWPMVSGGSHRTAWAENEWSLAPPFDEMDIFTEVYGRALATKGDTLYVGQSTSPNTVAAVDIESGTLFWTFEIDSSGGSIGCTPAVSDSIVFCGGQSGLGLFALDRFSGNEIWRREIGSLYTRNPIIDDERVYVIQDSLYCFNARTGNTIWNYPLGWQLTPSLDDSCVYTSTGGMVYALDKFNGNEKWIIPSGRSGETVSILDQRLIVSGYQSIVALRKEDGTEIWNHEIVDGTLAFLNEGAIAVSDEAVVYSIWENSDLEAELRALDINTGSEIWRATFDTVGVFTPVIANNVVYAVEWLMRTLWGFDIASGAVLYSESGGYFGQPIVANHALFVKIGMSDDVRRPFLYCQQHGLGVFARH